MSNALHTLDQLPALLVCLVAFAMMTGALRLADGDMRNSRRGPGGLAHVAAGLLFLYVAISAGGGTPVLEQGLRDLVTGFLR